jgi:hypothetical protein
VIIQDLEQKLVTGVAENGKDKRFF